MPWQLVRGGRPSGVSLRVGCEPLEPRAYLSAASFGSAIALPANNQVVGNSIPSAVSGAFTSSGLEDVAVLDSQDSGIDILLNQGNGKFTLGSVLADGGGQVVGLAAANLGNGQIDLVASNITTGSIYVYLGNGDGTFAAPQVYRFATPESSRVSATDFVTIADLNGDGNPDLIVADDVDNQIVTFLNQGGGALKLTQSLSTVEPGAVVVGNFFGAGNSLYAVTNSGQAFLVGSTGTLVGIGAINFGVPSNQSYVGVGQLVTGDFNNDGVADIAKLFLGGDGKSYVDLLPGGTGAFGPSVFSQVTSGATSLAVGDFNADGNEDLLVGSASSTELFDGNGTGAMTDADVSLDVGGWQIADPDSFTTSGNLDVVLPGISESTGKPGAFLFENGGSAAATVTLVSSQNPAGPGQLVQFTAKVISNGTAATGKVELLDSGKEIAIAGLANGVAHFSTKKLIIGGHDLTAHYVGSSTLPAGSSPVLLETIGQGLGVGDLTPSFPAKNIPASLVAGSKLSESLDLVNNGTGPSSGVSHISFYASPTSTYDSATAVLVGAAKQTFSLKVGKKAAFSTKLTFPADLTPGSYYLLATITDGNGHANTVSTTATTAVAAPFVQLSDKVLSVSSPVKPGKKATVSLEVFNAGNVIAADPLVIDLETSTDSDGSDPQAWTTLTKKISIKPKGHSVLSLSGALPAGLAAGGYFVVATIDPSNTFHEPSPANHIAVSAKAITLT